MSTHARRILVLITALVAWLPAAQPFLESGGRVVMEVESAPLAGSWTAETYRAGYTGSGFREWKKGNPATGVDAAGTGIMSYPITISTAGRYRLQIRGQPAHNTEHNDVWVRVLGATKVEAVRTNGTDLRNLGAAWTKSYNNSAGVWSWNSWTVDHDQHAIYAEFSAGAAATVELSGRSTQFCVDRIVLYTSAHTEAQATNTSLAESPRATGGGTPTVGISGELKRWHKVTLTMDGPSASEGGTPNPFTDYRFDVTFSNGSLSYVMPGYFAADGNAGETSATSGNKWRAHLSPDTTGTWTWTTSFRQGTNVAQNGGGTTVSPYHGLTGTFTVGATDKTGRDFRGKGRLQYVGQRYLRHKGTNEWFIKAGADAPENLLNNTEIDGTVTQSGTDRRHNWSAHVSDWQAGDPVWQGTKGKGIIGAINYLAGTGCNVFSFLTMNINGDSKDVWPYTDHAARTRMDCSKLDQWESIFEHATRKGMYLHFKTQETENETLLDGGALGNERKLYYRELVARFGHHLALNWNLGEESNDQTDQQRKDMAAWFHANDPYRHLVVIHSYPEQSNQNVIYRPLLGTASQLTGASVQTQWNNVHLNTRQWIDESTAAGVPWVVANDEQGSADDGVPPQAGWTGYGGGGPGRADLRHQVLWGNLMAGGAGVETYFGYAHPESDLACRNWRSRADWWAMCSHALVFMRTHLPFNEMTSNDPLVGNSTSAGSGRYCFAKAGAVYAVYIPSGVGGSATLNLSGQTGTYLVQWYNPRAGGALQNGSVLSVTGGGSRGLGNPPAESVLDWVVLVELSGGVPPPPPPTNVPPTVIITTPANGASFTAPANIAAAASASDSDGTVSKVEFLVDGVLRHTETLAPYDFPWNAVPVGTYQLTARATDDDGATTTSTAVTVTVTATTTPPPPSTPASPTVTGDGTATPTLSGVTDPGAVVHIFVNGVEVGTVTAAGDGSWNYTVSGLPAGTHTITVTSQNAGGTSPASPPRTVTVAGTGSGGGGGSGGSSSGSSGGSCGLGGLSAMLMLMLMALFGRKP